MGLSLVSNPPYNLKWCIPPFAQIQSRFIESEVPPDSNANYAFVLSGIELATDKAAFILPCNILSTTNKKEYEIRKYLVEKNLIESVILCPDDMFEKTSISTCILVINKQKETTDMVFIDMRNIYDIECREQNGQYGGKSHTNRTYKKDIKIFNDEHIKKAIDCINKRTTIPEFSITVALRTVSENEYNLSPGRYIEFINEEVVHRDYSEIVSDINRIINEKNACKLTINETLAKILGFDIELYKNKQDIEINAMLKNIGIQPIIKENYFITTKKKNEIKFENASKEILSSILVMILSNWKQHIYYLNNEENRYLMELRDAMLPDLMSGKIDLEEGDEKND